MGNVEVLINNGSVPCNLKPIGKTKYLATFKPKSSMSLIDVRFNNESLPNGPFRLGSITNGHCEDQTNVAFHIDSMENFKTNTQTNFGITVKNYPINKEDLSVTIMDSLSSVLNYRIIEESPNVYKVVFSASNVGSYQFKIFYKNVLVHTFAAKAYDISKISMSGIPKKVIVGQKCNIQGNFLFDYLF